MGVLSLLRRWGYGCVLNDLFSFFRALPSTVGSFFVLTMLFNLVPLSPTSPWSPSVRGGCSGWKKGSPTKDDGEAPSEGISGSADLTAGFKSRAKLLGSLGSPLLLRPAGPPPCHASPGHGPSGPEYGPVMKLGSTRPQTYKEKNTVDHLGRLKLHGT